MNEERRSEEAHDGSLGAGGAPRGGKDRGVGIIGREGNVGTVEQWIRMILGDVALIAGLWLFLHDLGSLLFVSAAVVSLLLGVGFMATGLFAYCPLYHRLGWSTARRNGDIA